MTRYDVLYITDQTDNGSLCTRKKAGTRRREPRESWLGDRELRTMTRRSASGTSSFVSAAPLLSELKKGATSASRDIILKTRKTSTRSRKIGVLGTAPMTPRTSRCCSCDTENFLLLSACLSPIYLHPSDFRCSQIF
jgi:hypothetical protein